MIVIFCPNYFAINLLANFFLGICWFLNRFKRRFIDKWIGNPLAKRPNPTCLLSGNSACATLPEKKKRKKKEKHGEAKLAPYRPHLQLQARTQHGGVVASRNFNHTASHHLSCASTVRSVHSSLSDSTLYRTNFSLGYWYGLSIFFVSKYCHLQWDFDLY